jgi:hypothetical protein
MYHLNIPPDRQSPAHQLPQRSSVAKGSSPESQVVGFNHTQHQQQVRQFSRNLAPAWLKSLLTIQRGSSILFGSVLGLSVIVYGYTASTQGAWKTQHKQLKRFQAQEQQQAVMNENLKQEMAQTAEQPASGLVDPSPDRLVFIPSAPQRPAKSLPTPPSQSPPKSKLPLGY